LVYWRRRLAASDRPYRVVDAIQAVIAQTGILRGKNKRVFDSTIMDDGVATQDTVTQLISMIRRVAREVPGAADLIATQCAGDYRQPGKPKIDWSDPAERDALVSMLVADATLPVAAFADATLTEEQAQTVALLALVAGQDVEPADSQAVCAEAADPGRAVPEVCEVHRHCGFSATGPQHARGLGGQAARRGRDHHHGLPDADGIETGHRLPARDHRVTIP
jgi:hypothetical protein